jgi:hypothetical protein
MKIPRIPRHTLRAITELEERGYVVVSGWDGREWRHAVKLKEKHGRRVQ